MSFMQSSLYNISAITNTAFHFAVFGGFGKTVNTYKRDITYDYVQFNNGIESFLISTFLHA